MTSPLGALPRLHMFQDPTHFTMPWASWFSTLQQIAQATSSSGPTTQRPTTNTYVGQFYFDTTLGKPIWVKTPGAAPGWVDATGAPA